jgi:hypothetical protein
MSQPDFVHDAPYPARTSDDKIIVSAGIDGHYAEGLRSLRNHAKVYAPDHWRLLYEELPAGCPPQAIANYAFKIFALDRAIAAGFRFVLWLDAAFAPVGSLDRLWAYVERNGWYIPPQADSVLGEWSSDSALDLLGMTRDKAMTIPLVFSGVVALDMQSVAAQQIYDRWKWTQVIGSWNGPHKNEPGVAPHAWGQKTAGHCSDSPTVYGHRHDESALSWVLHSLNHTPVFTGFISQEDPAGCIIAHHVPDFDVVKMREHLLRSAGALEAGGENTEKALEIRSLCR